MKADATCVMLPPISIENSLFDQDNVDIRYVSHIVSKSFSLLSHIWVGLERIISFAECAFSFLPSHI